MIATALTLTLTLSAPFTALSQTAPAAEDLRARAKLEADGIKSKALSRLHTEATYIPESGKSKFRAAMKNAMELQLQALRKRYAAAEAYLNEHIGYGTPWYATWQGIWNNQEAAAKVFQDIISRLGSGARRTATPKTSSTLPTTCVSVRPLTVRLRSPIDA